MTLRKLLAASLFTLAVSAYAGFAPTPGYTSDIVIGSASIFGGFDVFEVPAGKQAYAYSSGSLKQFDVSNGGQLADLGKPGAYADSAFVSFVRRSPDGNSVWVGYTVGGNTDDRIYEVTDLGGTPTWNLRSTVAGNYDLAFRGSEAFVTASDYVNNTIYLLDSSNNYTAVSFATAGAFSAGLGFGATDLYYATSGLISNQLISFSGTDINNFLVDPSTWTPLSIGDATTLSSIPSAGAGLFVDSAGGVFFTVNDFAAFPSVDAGLLQWNGVIGAGDNFDIIGTNTDNTSLGFVSGVGDLASGGTLYTTAYGVDGLYQVAVPEPSQYALMLGIAILLLPLSRRLRKVRA